MRPKSVNADPQEGKIAHEDLRRVRAFVLFMEEMGTIPGSCPELSQQEIEDAFAEGGTVENIVPSRYEVRLDFIDRLISRFGRGLSRGLSRPVKELSIGPTSSCWKAAKIWLSYGTFESRRIIGNRPSVCDCCSS